MPQVLITNEVYPNDLIFNGNQLFLTGNIISFCVNIKAERKKTRFTEVFKSSFTFKKQSFFSNTLYRLFFSWPSGTMD
jgi:hypothetical protein